MSSVANRYKEIGYDGLDSEIPPPTDEEWDAIYEEFEDCTVPSNASANGQVMHLHPPGGDDGERVCDGLSKRSSKREYKTKPIGAYPKKYLGMCSFCLFRWRRA